MSGTQPPSPVAGGKAPATPARRAAIVAVVLLVLLVLYWLGGGIPSRRPAVVAEDTSGAGSMRPTMMPPPEPPRAPPEVTPANIAIQPQQTQQRRQNSTPRAPLKAAPIMAFEERDGEASTAAARGSEEAGNGEGELTTRLTATRTPPTRARRLRNPTMTITQGTMIPCVRETPINTQLPGFVRCIVSEGVVGQQGTVTLIDRGAKIVGQIQNAVSHGQNRAFILWTRLENPDGVLVDLSSPGTDAMGTNGVQLDINTNFWARFGGAIMLSFIDAGLQAAAIGLSQAAHSGNGQSVNFLQLQGGGRSAAARSLDATVNIPPFGTSPQGMPEAVFVARDLDFSAVYDLRQVR